MTRPYKPILYNTHGKTVIKQVFSGYFAFVYMNEHL